MVKDKCPVCGKKHIKFPKKCDEKLMSDYNDACLSCDDIKNASECKRIYEAGHRLNELINYCHRNNLWLFNKES